MQETKDKRLSKQLGDFGETLVLFLLGHKWGYRTAIVDHTGVDIIATDRKENGKKYAISVKSRRFITDDPSTGLDIKQQEAIKEFANEFDQIPAVAWVLITKGEKEGEEIVDVYLLTLESFEKLANRVKGIRKTDNGELRISNAIRNQKTLRNLKSDIGHIKIKIDALSEDWLTGNLVD